jgi:predicted nuclease of restriction endonuclease-like (RecB) superfamily
MALKPEYTDFLSGVQGLLDEARRRAARAVNTALVATYWEVGRRIVEYEQKGKARAKYGQALMARLAKDLTTRMGRGFSQRNLEQMRLFYRSFQIAQTPSAPLALEQVGRALPLTWSHYAQLLSLKTAAARSFYAEEARRGGWSVRQMERQIGSQLYERTLLSKDKASMLRKAGDALPADKTTPEEEIKDPYVLEFLNLKDEYSESDLEEALIRHLEAFLLELGSEFAFVARQKRLRVGDAWYRVDLVFYHRKLRCLVLIDLKLGKFTHADAGQMHLYLNYAREHWTLAGENPPVGLILCAQKDAAVAHYALEGLPNKVMAAEYRTSLPGEKELAEELERTRLALGRKPA